MIIGEDDKWRGTTSDFLEVKLSDLSDVAREIVTDGFVFTDTNATVHDSLVTLTYTAPYLTENGFVFINSSGREVAWSHVDMTQFNSTEILPLVDAHKDAVSGMSDNNPPPNNETVHEITSIAEGCLSDIEKSGASVRRH